MSKASHKDFACLNNMIDSIEKIKQYSSPYSNADELFEDSKSFDAVMMNFMVIGEMAEKLSDGFKHSTQQQIDWFRIRGFRNIIAHNYFGIDAEEVWQIMEDNLPNLENSIRNIISD